MNRDPLEQLLRDADEAVEQRRVQPDLAQRVRAAAAAARRGARRTRLAAGGLVTGCVAAMAVWLVRPGSDPVIAPPAPPAQVAQSEKPDADRARAELAALSAEADRRAEAAEAMWSAQAAPRRRASLAAAAPDIADHIERAAFTMVYQAARMPAKGGARSPAADVYRQVSRAFPDAPSAQVARQRLVELTNRKDG